MYFLTKFVGPKVSAIIVIIVEISLSHYYLQGYIEGGLFKFTYGSKDCLVDFLHGDNFCQAHIKAAEAMDDDSSPVVRSV